MSFLAVETSILLLLLVACLSAFIFRPLKLPYTVGLVVVGFGIGQLEGAGLPAGALGGLMPEYRSPEYSAAVGLVCYAAAAEEVGSAPETAVKKTQDGFLEKLKKWMKEFF